MTLTKRHDSNVMKMIVAGFPTKDIAEVLSLPEGDVRKSLGFPPKLPAVAPIGASRRRGVRWTAGEDETLRQLLANGQTYAWIGKRIGRCPGSVAGRIATLRGRGLLPAGRLCRHERSVLSETKPKWLGKEKIRKCLRCHDEFASEWAGHRSCPECANTIKSEEYRGFEEMTLCLP